MEKNIAALMREDARTVHVSFYEAPTPSAADEQTYKEMLTEAKRYGVSHQILKAPDARLYTYVTDMQTIAVGDCVVVQAAGQIKAASVRQVDEAVMIEPNSKMKFGWVLARVDLAPAIANEKRNAEIEEAVAEAYKVNLRRSFASSVLAGLDDASKDRITALIGGPK